MLAYKGKEVSTDNKNQCNYAFKNLVSETVNTNILQGHEVSKDQIVAPIYEINGCGS